MADRRIPRAPQFDAEHARRWHEADAAEAYRHRLPYPPDSFEVLEGLITDGPRTLLDLGCGTGEIARALAPRVARVDWPPRSPRAGCWPSWDRSSRSRPPGRPR
jgi:methylase of polypeptide subunit release factors